MKNLGYVYTRLIYDLGEAEICGDTREILNWSATWNPEDTFVHGQLRSSNKDYIEKEFRWYLSQDPNIALIEPHAKLWRKVADENGNVNSNYGYHMIPQIPRIVEEFGKDINTRRATIFIGSRSISEIPTEDVPCTNTIWFVVRDNKLHCTVTMRSNDAVWGFLNDTAWFTVFQRSLLMELNEKLETNLELGSYTHIAHSMHIYKRHWNLLKSMASFYSTPLKIDQPIWKSSIK